LSYGWLIAERLAGVLADVGKLVDVLLADGSPSRALRERLAERASRSGA